MKKQNTTKSLIPFFFYNEPKIITNKIPIIKEKIVICSGLFPKEVGRILSPVIYIINPAVAPTIKPVAEGVICSYKNNATKYPTKIGIAVDFIYWLY